MKHKVLIAASIAAAVFLLGACAQKVWTKPGATQSDFGQDRYACLQQSQQHASSAYVNSAGGVANEGAITNGLLFNGCMNSKGWSLGDQPSAQQQAASVNPLQVVADQNMREIRQRCAADEFRPFYANTGCIPAEITLENLANKSKATEVEKPAISKFQIASRAATKRLQDAQRNFNGEKGHLVANALENNLKDSEKNLFELYSGNISWGDFNRLRKESNQRLQDELNQINMRR
jgi:hypothetical protein